MRIMIYIHENPSPHYSLTAVFEYIYLASSSIVVVLYILIYIYKFALLPPSSVFLKIECTALNARVCVCMCVAFVWLCIAYAVLPPPIANKHSIETAKSSTRIPTSRNKTKTFYLY